MSSDPESARPKTTRSRNPFGNHPETKAPFRTAVERNDFIKSRLYCPTCGKPLIVYPKSMACENRDCGGIIGPSQVPGLGSFPMALIARAAPERLSMSKIDNA